MKNKLKIVCNIINFRIFADYKKKKRRVKTLIYTVMKKVNLNINLNLNTNCVINMITLLVNRRIGSKFKVI